MSRRRASLILAAAFAACAVPASAHAATLAPAKPCYAAGDTLVLVGAGYTSGGQVRVAANGTPLSPALTAGPTGAIVGNSAVPATRLTTVTDVFTATDLTNDALVGTTKVTRSALRVSVRPQRAGPTTLRRITVRGFTTGATLYRHTIRGTRVTSSRQGALTGACRTGSYRQRLFGRGVRFGTYTVQFDTQRRYSTKTLQRVRFRVSVSPTAKRAGTAAAATERTSATAAGTERWARIK